MSMTLNQKSLDYYLSLPYTIQVEQTDLGGKLSYFANYLELPDCHGYGATPEEAKKSAKEVLEIWIEARLEHQDILIPEP